MQKRYKTLRSLYNMCLFPLAGFNLTLVLAFAFINNKRIVLAGEETFPLWVNSLSLLVGWTIVAGVATFEVVRKKWDVRTMEIGGECEMNPWYALVFLAKLVLTALLIPCFMASSGEWASLTLTLLVGAYTIALAVFRPYNNLFGNCAAIAYELTALYALSLVILNSYLSLGENAELFLIFVLEGLIALCTCLCLARTLRFYYQMGCSRSTDIKEETPARRGKLMKKSMKMRRKEEEAMMRNALEDEGLLFAD
jgi:hypothetical protein